jgi:hypothetical protein
MTHHHPVHVLRTVLVAISLLGILIAAPLHLFFDILLAELRILFEAIHLALDGADLLIELVRQALALALSLILQAAQGALARGLVHVGDDVLGIVEHPVEVAL